MSPNSRKIWSAGSFNWSLKIMKKLSDVPGANQYPSQKRKKAALILLPVITVLLEVLPYGAVCIFASSPTERIRETFSYFSLVPFGYANFSPFITAVLTVVIIIFALISLKKGRAVKIVFVISIIAAVVSVLPLMYGVNCYSIVGCFISITLGIEIVMAKISQK